MHPHHDHYSGVRRVLYTLIGGLLCCVMSGCGQSASGAAPAAPSPTSATAPSPTVDPLTLNICATCDVQQRRLQATAAAEN